MRHAAILLVLMALVACGDDSGKSDGAGDSRSSDIGSDSAPAAGDFEIFNCSFEYTCDDGTETSTPLITCTTQNVLSALILQADTNGVCDKLCLNNGSDYATSCVLECSPAGTACSCPAGLAECNP